MKLHISFTPKIFMAFLSALFLFCRFSCSRFFRICVRNKKKIFHNPLNGKSFFVPSAWGGRDGHDFFLGECFNAHPRRCGPQRQQEQRAPRKDNLFRFCIFVRGWMRSPELKRKTARNWNQLPVKRVHAREQAKLVGQLWSRFALSFRGVLPLAIFRPQVATT